MPPKAAGQRLRRLPRDPTFHKKRDPMNPQQHPLGTSFTAASTADEVLTGLDLTGKNVIVTGGHAGLGLEASRALSKAGASVTVGARHPERAAAALAGIERVELSQLDLLDPASIDAFAARWLGSGRPLHGPRRPASTTCSYSHRPPPPARRARW